MAAKGQSVEPLDNKPELDPSLRPFWHAFMHLSAARQHTETTPQPISLVEVLAYCQLAGFDDLNDREELLRFVRDLDSTYLDGVKRNART